MCVVKICIATAKPNLVNFLIEQEATNGVKNKTHLIRMHSTINVIDSHFQLTTIPN